MRPITVTVGPLGSPDADAVATTQTPLGAGDLTLTADPVVLSTAQRIGIDCAADESGRVFTITGTNWAGDPISEELAGENVGVAQSVLDYLTVSSVAIDGAATGAIQVGTVGVGASPWVRFDDYGPNFISIQADVDGTVNYTVQATLDDPNAPTSPIPVADMVWINTNDTNVVGATTSQQSNFGFAPAFARVLLNSGTGSVRTTFLQSGTVPK